MDPFYGFGPRPTINHIKPRLTRGQRQYIDPFKPKEYPNENWAWGVGEAIKQGKRIPTPKPGKNLPEANMSLKV